MTNTESNTVNTRDYAAEGYFTAAAEDARLVRADALRVAGEVALCIEPIAAADVISMAEWIVSGSVNA